MKRAAFNELIQRLVSGGIMGADLQNRYDSDVIKTLAELAYNQVIAKIYKTASESKDFSEIDTFVKTYEADILFDESLNEHYVELPVPIVILPNCGGVRRMCPTKDLTFSYKPLDEAEVGLIQDTDAYMVLEEPMFYTRGSQLRIVKHNKNFKRVRLNLLIPLSEFEDDSEIGIPSENSFDVLNIIRKILIEQPQEHKVVTGNSKQI